MNVEVEAEVEVSTEEAAQTKAEKQRRQCLTGAEWWKEGREGGGRKNGEGGRKSGEGGGMAQKHRVEQASFQSLYNVGTGWNGTSLRFQELSNYVFIIRKYCF